MTAMSIVFVSAKTEDFWREKADHAGAVGYITKPIDTDSFVQTVESLA